MKKIKFLSVVILSSTVLGGVAHSALAEEKSEQNLKSEVQVEFTADENGETIPNPTPPGGGEDGEEITDPSPGGVVPGEKGPLMINYVPNFDFDKHVIGTQGFQAYANVSKVGTASGVSEVPHFAQVTDIRGNHAGWNLTVSASDLTLDGAGNEKLDGVSMTFNPVTLDSPGGATSPEAAPVQTINFPQDAQTLMAAKQNTGEGTWSASFGSSEMFEDGKNKGVMLDVPDKAVAQASVGKYQAVLSWNLTGNNEINKAGTPISKS